MVFSDKDGCRSVDRIICGLVTPVKSSLGGLMVEQWSNNRLLSAMVDRIPLGTTIYIDILVRSIDFWDLTLKRVTMCKL